MILNETYTLSNSVKIPKLGLGTWMLTDSEAAQAVCENCRSEAELPQEFKDYIAYIEQETGVPVRILSLGPDRDQTIIRQ